MFTEEFFPTPPVITAKMRARISKDAQYFLEPNAGKGDLAEAIRGERGYDRKKVDCIEISPELCAILQDKDFPVVGTDWLEYDGVCYYDAIVMNPPFSNGDAHLLKAWDFLHDGEIVCLLNEETIKNPHTKNRKRLAAIIEQHGEVEYLGDCFSTAERKTGVRVALVYLKKEAEDDRLDLWANESQERDIADDIQAGNIPAVMDSLGNMQHYYDAANIHMFKAFQHIRKAAIYMEANGHKYLKSDYDNILPLALENINATKAEFSKIHRNKSWHKVFSRMEFHKWLDHIKNNENPHFKAGSGKNFTIATPKQEDEAADLLRPYFPERHFVPLPEILSTVNAHTDFLQEFQHWQQRYTKGRTDDKVLYAGIVGLGCAIGIPKMSRISKLITESALQHAVNWYFSLENIRAANDCIVQFMDRMELPNIYRKNHDSLHTASDGQKFEVRADSLNANYSFKYFGKGQGVTANTFIDERNLLWHSLVFSASERESAYVIDGLMHNDVIKSDIHSTDTHGYSEAIFATTHMLGFSYAPRIKNLKKQVLYIFKSGKHDLSDWAVQPTKYVNETVIEECWDDILRLVTTIKLKETSASDIFRRLNSYSKQHRLYQALKAFGQIIKSDFILRYIDDADLRQAIEKQLNKVELANRFTRAIAVGNPREFTQGDKEEQEIAESCNRLIKNAIICWNYLYLSQKLESMDNPEQRERLLAAISSHSPMSWSHTNLLGEYDFSDEKLKDTAGIRLPKIAA